MIVQPSATVLPLFLLLLVWTVCGSWCHLSRSEMGGWGRRERVEERKEGDGELKSFLMPRRFYMPHPPLYQTLIQTLVFQSGRV